MLIEIFSRETFTYLYFVAMTLIAASFIFGATIHFLPKYRNHYGKFFFTVDGSWIFLILNIVLIFTNLQVPIAAVQIISEGLAFDELSSIKIVVTLIIFWLLLIYLLFRPSNAISCTITSMSKLEVAIIQSIILFIPFLFVLFLAVEFVWVVVENPEKILGILNFSVLDFLGSLAGVGLVLIILAPISWPFIYLLRILRKDLRYKKAAFLQIKLEQYDEKVGRTIYPLWQDLSDHFYSIRDALIYENDWHPHQFPEDEIMVSYQAVSRQLVIFEDLPRNLGFRQTAINNLFSKGRFFFVNYKRYSRYLESNPNDKCIPEQYSDYKSKSRSSKNLVSDLFCIEWFSESFSDEARVAFSSVFEGTKIDRDSGATPELMSLEAFLTKDVIFLEKKEERHKWSLLRVLGW